MAGRRLNAEDLALWARVSATVKPIASKRAGNVSAQVTSGLAANAAALKVAPLRTDFATSQSVPAPKPVPHRVGPGTLDGGWDKRLIKGAVSPDFTIDLHGETLATAHVRLNQSLGYALSIDARVILLITGRPARDNPRLPPTTRGVIRASVKDWLHVSAHASMIAAIRPAHPRHGGNGALYIILRRRLRG
jgi:DNA-nicking Smr family endonuclease